MKGKHGKYNLRTSQINLTATSRCGMYDARTEGQENLWTVVLPLSVRRVDGILGQSYYNLTIITEGATEVEYSEGSSVG